MARTAARRAVAAWSCNGNEGVDCQGGLLGKIKCLSATAAHHHRRRHRMHHNKSLTGLGKEAQDNKITSIIGLTLVCLARRRPEVGCGFFFFFFISPVLSYFLWGFRCLTELCQGLYRP